VSGRGRARHALAVIAIAIAASLTACGDGEADPPAGASSPDTSSPGTSSPETSSPDTDTDTDGDAVRVEVRREGDAFTPNGERVEVGVGQTLVLELTADESGELHVHSTPEQEIAYDEGTSEHEITIDRPGVVEVESHEPDTIVLQLEVR
jgi:hypothetical protein